MITHLVDGHMKGQVTERDVADIVDRCEAKSLMDNFTCPFCHEIIPETRISLQKHVGTHMDEIALKVLPQDIDSANDTSGDDDDDSNSEASVSPRGDDTDRSISRPPEDVEVPSTHAGQSSEEFFVCPWPDCQDELNLNKYIQCLYGTRYIPNAKSS